MGEGPPGRGATVAGGGALPAGGRAARRPKCPGQATGNAGPGPVRSTDRAALRQRSWTRRDRAHPQLLHHQPRRPRQVDALGPHPRDHRARSTPGSCASSTSTPWTSSGSGASPSRPRTSGSTARRPRPAPHRHARPRRLRLRGVPVAGRLRGGGAAGRRLAGDPGPDAGQLLPGPRERPRDRPGAQQDRPAGGRPRALRARDRARAGPAGRGHPAHLGQDGRGGARAARRRHRPGPAARGRPRRAPARPDLRLVLRPVPRRGQLHPHRRRHAADRVRGCASCRPTPCTTSRRSGVRTPDAVPVEAARPRRGGLPHRRHQGRRRRPAPARRSPRPSTGPTRPWPATATPSPWCSAASTRSTATSCPTCATRSTSSSSTTPASPSSPSPPTRSASASAAASSACCTWRSCGSASSASSTSRSSPPRPAWRTGRT